jgi:hypothetical protein
VRAGFAVLKENDGELDVTIQRVEYDTEGAARDVAAAGLPPEYADKLLAAA